MRLSFANVVSIGVSKPFQRDPDGKPWDRNWIHEVRIKQRDKHRVMLILVSKEGTPALQFSATDWVDEEKEYVYDYVTFCDVTNVEIVENIEHNSIEWQIEVDNHLGRHTTVMDFGGCYQQSIAMNCKREVIQPAGKAV